MKYEFKSSILNQYFWFPLGIMMLRWGTIVQISNHILATLSGTASAILVKWYLKEKAPGLQTFLDVSIIEATNSYIIFNISCNLSMGKKSILSFSYMSLFISCDEIFFSQNISTRPSIPRNGWNIQILFGWFFFNCPFKFLTYLSVCLHSKISYYLS